MMNVFGFWNKESDQWICHLLWVMKILRSNVDVLMDTLSRFLSQSLQVRKNCTRLPRKIFNIHSMLSFYNTLISLQKEMILKQIVKNSQFVSNLSRRKNKSHLRQI